MFPIPFSPRLILAGIAATAILATAGGLYIKGRHDAAERAKAAVAASQQAQRQAEVTTEALDQHSTRVVVIREKADASVRIVQQAAGAETPIPPDVLRAWRSGVGLQHDQAPNAPDHPSDASGTLPPT